ncbi:MAG TPA: MMPL family transporter [Ktedonobacteraceae bacterium]|nr:MMPL family transporter [Ktedonobacteraceae bacterium]
MAIFSFIGRLSVRYRYIVIVVWLVVAAFCIHSFPSLSSVANSDNSSFLPGTAPSLHAAQLASPFQPNSGSTAVLVAMRNGGTLTTEDQSAFTTIENAVKNVAHVTSVRDQGVSGDGEARKALITINLLSTSSQASSVVDNIRATISSNAVPQGLTVNLTGQLPTNIDNQQASQHAQRLTTLLSDLAILVMLLLVFRAVLAPLITLAPAVLVLLLAGPVIAEASTVGLPVSSVTQTILTVLILGAGTDYGLFLILRVHEELRRGHTSQQAVIEAVEHVGESITFSAGTVIGALLCLLLATFGIYRGLGPSLAIGIALMLLAALTLLPALLSIFGRAAFWPSKVSPGADKPGAWGQVAGQIVRRPALTLIIGVVLFGVLTVAAFGYAPAGFAGTTTGPSGSDSANGTAAISAHYPAAVAKPTTVLLQFPTSVWSNLTVVQQAEQQLSRSSEFHSVSGPLNPNGTAITPAQLEALYAQLGSPSALPPVPPSSVTVSARVYNAYRSTAQFISPDGRTVAFYTTLAAGDPGSTSALQAIPNIRQAVSQVAQSVGAIDSGVSGQAAVAYDVSNASDTDLVHIVPVVLLLIAILLSIVMRSLIAPLYLVVSVVFSFGASLGIAVLIFMRIGGDAGLDFVLPFLMFIFLMALGEDYNILVMSRIREEALKGSLKDAITRAVNATGTTVTSAGLILAATFGVAGILGATDQIHQLGIGIAIGILLDTFLVRTLLVPSIVALLAHWNWWPSKLAFQARAGLAAEAKTNGEHAVEVVETGSSASSGS